MNIKNGRFLEVGDDADPEGPDPAEVEPQEVDLDGLLSDFVTDEKLVNLFVSDVDNDSHLGSMT